MKNSLIYKSKKVTMMSKSHHLLVLLISSYSHWLLPKTCVTAVHQMENKQLFPSHGKVEKFRKLSHSWQTSLLHMLLVFHFTLQSQWTAFCLLSVEARVKMVATALIVIVQRKTETNLLSASFHWEKCHIIERKNLCIFKANANITFFA